MNGGDAIALDELHFDESTGTLRSLDFIPDVGLGPVRLVWDRAAQAFVSEPV